MRVGREKVLAAWCTLLVSAEALLGFPGPLVPPPSFENDAVTAFWSAAGQTGLHLLFNDTSLPADAPQPDGSSVPGFSVALCITGGARGFPRSELGIFDAIREHVVEALGANRTDIYYVLDLNSDTDDDIGSYTGRFNYSVGDLAVAFEALPPAAAVLTAKHPSHSRKLCHSRCYTQFAKLQTCLDMLQLTERENDFRYDFVVRQRPDLAPTAPLPHVSTLRRAVYAPLNPYGVADMYYYGHRDFADAMLGMVQLLAYRNSVPPDWPHMSGSCVAGFRELELFATRGPLPHLCQTMSCECWLKASLALRNTTLVSVEPPVFHVVRMPR
jgi:hypothetical protein